MKKIYFFAAVFLFVGGLFSVHAQDLIIQRDGNIIETKVMEISPTEIKYKRIEHLDGPTITVPRTDILTIRYENGTVEIVNALPAARQRNTQANNSGYNDTALDPDKPNFSLSVNPAGFLSYAGGGPSLSADFTKNKFSFMVDISSGFGMTPTLFATDLIGGEWLGFGLSFNYFNPSRIGGFYVGGLLKLSISDVYSPYRHYVYYARGDDDYYDDDYYDDGYYTTDYRLVTAPIFGIALNIGYKYITQSKMYFRTGANLGYSFGDWAHYIFRPDFSIGHSF